MAATETKSIRIKAVPTTNFLCATILYGRSIVGVVVEVECLMFLSNGNGLPSCSLPITASLITISSSRRHAFVSFGISHVNSKP
jgi:hypothetical protein